MKYDPRTRTSLVRTLVFSVLALMSGVAFFSTQALAKSVTVGLDGYSAQCWDSSAGYMSGGSGWVDVTASVDYGASILDTDTGAVLTDNQTIPVGTHLRLQQSWGNISWFQSGGHLRQSIRLLEQRRDSGWLDV